MSRTIILAVVGFIVAIAIAFNLAPARAVEPNSVVYTWEYAGISSHKLVCKQVVVYPKATVKGDRQPVRIISKVVSDQRCAGITKPRA